MPTSPTNKILVRTLVHDKYRPDRIGGDPVWVRGRDDHLFRPFTAESAEAVRAELDAAGRGQFWDL